MTALPRRTAALGAALLGLAACAPRATAEDGAPGRGPGVIVWRSGVAYAETVARLQQAVRDKGIRLFAVIDQGQLAAGAGIALHPSTLLLFGNPPLGIQFLTANPLAGLDWPVRLLVTEDAAGQVWIAGNAFPWIARRHGIADRDKVVAMASGVVASIVAAAGAMPA